MPGHWQNSCGWCVQDHQINVDSKPNNSSWACDVDVIISHCELITIDWSQPEKPIRGISLLIWVSVCILAVCWSVLGHTFHKPMALLVIIVSLLLSKLTLFDLTALILSQLPLSPVIGQWLRTMTIILLIPYCPLHFFSLIDQKNVNSWSSSE